VRSPSLRRCLPCSARPRRRRPSETAQSKVDEPPIKALYNNSTTLQQKGRRRHHVRLRTDVFVFDVVPLANITVGTLQEGWQSVLQLLRPARTNTVSDSIYGRGPVAYAHYIDDGTMTAADGTSRIWWFASTSVWRKQNGSGSSSRSTTPFRRPRHGQGTRSPRVVLHRPFSPETSKPWRLYPVHSRRAVQGKAPRTESTPNSASTVRPVRCTLYPVRCFYGHSPNCPSCGKPNRIPARHLSDTGRCGAAKRRCRLSPNPSGRPRGVR